MSSPPLVSVVTPVYNGAAFLEECIQSVCAQTYQNWDYTIVDNCSTDNTWEIIQRYAALDSRIRAVRNTATVKAFCNHNLALQQISAASKYCKVVFGDDWLFPECLEKMVDLAERHPSVGLVGSYVLEGTKVSCAGLPYPSTVVSGREICRRHFLDRLYVFGSANSLLYRSDLVKGRTPFFRDNDLHADTEVCFALLRHCDFGFVHQVLTFTRVQAESLTGFANTLQSSYPFALRLLREHGPFYLSPQEVDTLTRDTLRGYYRFLGKNLLLRREETFWAYHRREMKVAGFDLGWGPVALGAVRLLLDLALNPKATTERLFSGRRRSIRFPDSSHSVHIQEISSC